MDWAPKVQAVRARLDKMARLASLSAFGRAFAASGYGLSSVMYHAEFGGLPSAAQLEDVTATVARLVDGRWKHSWMRHTPRLAGVSRTMMLGHPREGGFGALDLQLHTQARWARWGVQLAKAYPLPPSQQRWWARVAWALVDGPPLPAHAGRLARLRRGRPTPLDLWQQCGKPRTAAMPGGWGSSDVLARVIYGLRALPPLEVLPPPSVTLAPGVVFAMPLWHNPLLTRLSNGEYGHDFADMCSRGLILEVQGAWYGNRINIVSDLY